MRTVISRRELVAAGVSTFGAITASAQERQVKVGIVGLGLRSNGHLAALKRSKDAHITALCDLESDRMRRVNSGLSSPAATYTDFRELIKDKNVDVVVIVTPGYLHHDMAIAAMQAGKDVLVEKPMAFTYAEALEVKRASEQYGRILAIGMQRRYSRADETIQRLVDTGEIGPIRLIQYHEFRDDWNPASWQYTDPVTGKRTNWRFLKKRRALPSWSFPSTRWRWCATW